LYGAELATDHKRDDHGILLILEGFDAEEDRLERGRLEDEEAHEIDS
jgi:hypothetical protein